MIYPGPKPISWRDGLRVNVVAAVSRLALSKLARAVRGASVLFCCMGAPNSFAQWANMDGKTQSIVIAQAGNPITKIASPDFVTALGGYLSAGVIGLGLGVAILATIVVLSGRPGGKFLLFGLSLVLAGAVIEITKNVLQWRDINTLQAMSLNLPHDLWVDFRNARKQSEFGTAEPAGQDYEFELKKGETKAVAAYIPQGQCRYYFIATKPPGRLAITVRSEDILKRQQSSKGYYETGILCVEPNTSAVDAKIEIALLNLDNTVFFVTYIVPPDKTLFQRATAPPTSLPEIKKVVCTGEFESNCAGPHDIFITCKPPPDPVIAKEICTSLGRSNFSILRINTKGGNNCGYALTEVICK